MESSLPSDNINSFLSVFPMKKKDKYKWDILNKPKNDEESLCNCIYYGTNKKTKKTLYFVKQIKIEFKKENNDKLKHILKEAYFTFFLSKFKKYFPKKVKIKLSSDQKYLFLIFKGLKVSLNNYIKFDDNDSQKYQNLIKEIIFQITFGLYILHSKNIIHNDIKPSNILINKYLEISICDFGSAIFKNENSHSYTLYYASPEFLINNSKIDEKYDIWGLGVIMLELYCKKNLIFKKDDIKDKKGQIYYILSEFGVNENYSIEELKNELNENKKIKFNLNKKYLDKINDKDAVNLLNNLLVFNPKERFTAKEVLQSDYLKGFKEKNSFENELKEMPFKYEDISNNIIDHKKFVEFIEKLN